MRAEVKMGKIAGQSSEGAGIGFGRRRRLRPLDSRKAERQEILRVFKEIAEEERLVKIMSKPLIASDDHPSEKKGNFFCDWLKWKNASAADLRWSHLLQQQDSYLSVVLNSTQDSLPTPSRLKCWAQQSAGDGRCPLGCREAGTLKHILCGCQRAIKEPHSRITWRHDSVLLAIYRGCLSGLRRQKMLGRKLKRRALSPSMYSSRSVVKHNECPMLLYLKSLYIMKRMCLCGQMIGRCSLM